MDATCIICREEMTAETQPKRLPCSHVFHSHCLRSWFQRQQTCPTCRNDIWGRQAANSAAEARQRAAQVAAGAMNGQPQVQAQPQGQAPPPMQPLNMFPNIFAPQAAFAQRPPQAVPQQPTQGAASPQQNGDVHQQPPVGGQPGQGQFPHPIFYAPPPPIHGMPLPPTHNMMPPPFPPMPGGFMAPPPPPLPFPPRPTLDGLSDDELRQLEGDTRTALEGRIRLLQNVSTLLDAAVMHMQIYVNAMNSPIVNLPPSQQTTTTGSTSLFSNSAEETTAPGVAQENQPSTSANRADVSESEQASSTATPSQPKSLFSSESSKSLSRPLSGEEDANERADTSENSPPAMTRTPSSEEIRRRRLERFDRPSSVDSPSTSNT
ncbi:hypothetical protein WR25_05658 isoform A [Diploscapter pachys]|uniref:RING-type domain-containing protein n=2 Tax=Diploscapter pachys TaxID=2018661 RepID=A0A2A2LVD5_9BILA|nr:hypothetical protein WR25_05658 isoform A [Diploscapter pachys]